MTFKNYLSEAWNLHATDAQKVLDGFSDNIKLIESDADVLAMASLVVHVSGEHLGKWQDGLGILKILKTHASLTDMNSFNRSIAVLNLGSNPDFAINHYIPSDQARILAVTSSALAANNDLKRAGSYLMRSQDITVNELNKDDPANKGLAITGWNLACTLEEKENLSVEEKELMKLSANISRKFWEIAGDWRDVEQCEYRLTNTYLKASEPEQAMIHAKKCVEIVEAHGSEPKEAFYAYEALALASRAVKNMPAFENAKQECARFYELLSAEEQKACSATLDKIRG